MLNIDRQKVILTVNRYLAYLINSLIILFLVALVIFWIRILVLSTQ